MADRPETPSEPTQAISESDVQWRTAGDRIQTLLDSCETPRRSALRNWSGRWSASTEPGSSGSCGCSPSLVWTRTRTST